LARRGLFLGRCFLPRSWSFSPGRFCFFCACSSKPLKSRARVFLMRVPRVGFRKEFHPWFILFLEISPLFFVLYNLSIEILLDGELHFFFSFTTAGAPHHRRVFVHTYCPILVAFPPPFFRSFPLLVLLKFELWSFEVRLRSASRSANFPGRFLFSFDTVSFCPHPSAPLWNASDFPACPPFVLFFYRSAAAMPTAFPDLECFPFLQPTHNIS